VAEVGGGQGIAGGQHQPWRSPHRLLQHHDLPAPAATIPDDPLHRQGVEHLMGQHHPPAGRLRIVAGAEPAHGQGAVGQQHPLPCLHATVRFQQQQGSAAGQMGPVRRQAAGQIPGQAAFARPRFNQQQGAGAEGLQPAGHLAEQQAGEIGAEGGRGGEITAGADAQATAAIGTVVGIMQGPVHVGGEGHGTAGGPQAIDQPGRQLPGQGVCGAGVQHSPISSSEISRIPSWRRKMGLPS
jgi:hypothetical protein